MTDEAPRTEAGASMVARVDAHNRAYHPEWDQHAETVSLVERIEREAMSLETKAWLAEGYHRSEREAAAPPEPPRPERFDRSWWHYADDCPVVASGTALALDVELLAAALRQVKPTEMVSIDPSRQLAEAVAREYARLGTPSRSTKEQSDD